MADFKKELDKKYRVADGANEMKAYSWDAFKIYLKLRLQVTLLLI